MGTCLNSLMKTGKSYSIAELSRFGGVYLVLPPLVLFLFTLKNNTAHGVTLLPAGHLLGDFLLRTAHGLRYLLDGHSLVNHLPLLTHYALAL